MPLLLTVVALPAWGLELVLEEVPVPFPLAVPLFFESFPVHEPRPFPFEPLGCPFLFGAGPIPIDPWEWASVQAPCWFLKSPTVLS